MHKLRFAQETQMHTSKLKQTLRLVGFSCYFTLKKEIQIPNLMPNLIATKSRWDDNEMRCNLKSLPGSLRKHSKTAFDWNA